MTAKKSYREAWNTLFLNLTEADQETIQGSPDGTKSAQLALAAERLSEAREAAKGKGAGPERQLMERLEMENPL